MNKGGRDRIPTSASDLGLSKLEPLQSVDGMGLLLSRLRSKNALPASVTRLARDWLCRPGMAMEYSRLLCGLQMPEADSAP